MNEKFNKNAKVEKLPNMILGSGEEKGLIVKAPFHVCKWEECLYKGFKCFKNFNEYFMYLFRWKRGGVH